MTGPGPTGDFPLGTYRYELTAEDAAPVDNFFTDFTGVFTWEMGAGEWRLKGAPSTAGLEPIDCYGWFAVDRATVTFAYDPLSPGHCLPPRWTVRWAPGDGVVLWGPPSEPTLAPYFSLHPWERID